MTCVRFDVYSSPMEAALIAICLSGILLNLAYIRLLVVSRMQNSLLNLLMVLCVNNCLYLTLSGIHQLIPPGRNRSIFFAYCFGSIGTSLQTINVWVIVLLAGERYITVKYPFRARIILQRKYTKIAIAIVYSSVFIFNIAQFFSLNITEQGSYVLTKLASSNVYFILDMVYFVAMHGIPIILITVLNALMICIVKTLNVRVMDTFHFSEQATTKRKRETLRISISSAVLSLFFAISYIPTFLTYKSFVRLVFSDKGAGPYCSPVYMMYRYFAGMLMSTSCSLNFMVFLLFSKPFRIIAKKEIYKCIHLFRLKSK